MGQAEDVRKGVTRLGIICFWAKATTHKNKQEGKKVVGLTARTRGNKNVAILATFYKTLVQAAILWSGGKSIVVIGRLFFAWCSEKKTRLGRKVPNDNI